MILAGPPFNRPLAEIGWMTRRQMQVLFLRHRKADGTLDWTAVDAEEQAKKEPAKDDPHAAYRHIRRIQGVPEYLIQSEIRQALASENSRGRQPDQGQYDSARETN